MRSSKFLYVGAVVAFASFLTSVVGCSDPKGPFPASGKVRFTDGTPLPGGVIIFVSNETGSQARARIGQDGSFTLGTFSDSDGAVVGDHRVSVKPEITGFGAPPKHPVLRKYQAATTSGLVFTVTPDGPNEFEVVVERDKSPKAQAALVDR